MDYLLYLLVIVSEFFQFPGIFRVHNGVRRVEVRYLGRIVQVGHLFRRVQGEIIFEIVCRFPSSVCSRFLSSFDPCIRYAPGGFSEKRTVPAFLSVHLLYRFGFLRRIHVRPFLVREPEFVRVRPPVPSGLRLESYLVYDAYRCRHWVS